MFCQNSSFSHQQHTCVSTPVSSPTRAAASLTSLPVCLGGQVCPYLCGGVLEKTGNELQTSTICPLPVTPVTQGASCLPRVAAATSLRFLCPLGLRGSILTGSAVIPVRLTSSGALSSTTPTCGPVGTRVALKAALRGTLTHTHYIYTCYTHTIARTHTHIRYIYTSYIHSHTHATYTHTVKCYIHM